MYEKSAQMKEPLEINLFQTLLCSYWSTRRLISFSLLYQFVSGSKQRVWQSLINQLKETNRWCYLLVIKMWIIKVLSSSQLNRNTQNKGQFNSDRATVLIVQLNHRIMCWIYYKKLQTTEPSITVITETLTDWWIARFQFEYIFSFKMLSSLRGLAPE